LASAPGGNSNYSRTAPMPSLAEILKQNQIIYWAFLGVALFSSCKLHLTECKEVDSWDFTPYKIVKSNCLGPFGPRYFPLSVFKNEKFLGENAFQKDSCTITFQAEDDQYLVFNICNKNVEEISPNKQSIDLVDVDSVVMYSKELNKSKLLAKDQIRKFIEDWNNSEVSDYRDKKIDSIFYPSYMYKFTVYSKMSKREFTTGYFLINDMSHWTYYMTKKRDREDTNYFHEIWNQNIR